MTNDNRTVDLLVVGSGGGGLVAALVAAAAGKKVVVVEKQPKLGGTTAVSGGAVWIPNNPLFREAGGKDSYDEAWKYLDGLIGDVGPATSPARKKAYLTEGPRMVDFLRGEGLTLRYVQGYADYYAGRPGGAREGRSTEAMVFDGKKLGLDYQRLNPRTFLPAAIVITAQDLQGMTNGFRTWNAVRTTVRVVGRTLWNMVTRRAQLGMGMALVAQLMYALQRRGVEMLTDAPLQRLLTDASGKVTGAVVRYEGREIAFEAKHGVMLATGSFSQNMAMRAKYQPQVTGHWTHTPAGVDGDGIVVGQAVGAAVAQMDEAWWMPTTIAPDGTRLQCAFERSKPFSIMVDDAGERYCNEAASYMEVGQKMFKRQAERGNAMPSWLIFEARNRRYYPFATFAPGMTPRIAFDSGYLIRAQTLDELAQRCGIDAAGLKKTVERYNRMCANGKDEDFQRGDDPYDCFYGDPRIKPNPTMGPLEQAPFYAVKVYPGDIGTNGGLLTDEHARVLREDGTVIAGLYATGNCTASVMGRVYPGAGGTIGPSMVFGYAGAKHIVGGGRDGK